MSGIHVYLHICGMTMFVMYMSVVCKNGIVVNVYVYIWVVSVNMCVEAWVGRGSTYDQPLALCFMH